MDLVNHIQLESGSTSISQLKKQEGGLLIKVRDIVAVRNYLLQITKLVIEAAVSNGILLANDGTANTGNNNQHNCGKKQLKYSVQFVPRNFINQVAPSSGLKKIVYPSTRILLIQTTLCQVITNITFLINSSCLDCVNIMTISRPPMNSLSAYVSALIAP